MEHSVYHGFLFLFLLSWTKTVRTQTPTALIESLPTIAFTATSYYPGLGAWPPYLAKYSSSPKAWAPYNNMPNEYLLIDLGRAVKIYSIGTKGSSYNGPDFLTSCQLYYSLSEPTSLTNNGEMTSIGTLSGNTAWDTEALTAFSTPIIARYLKFRPLNYGGTWPVLRVEVYGHDTLTPTSAPTHIPSALPTEPPTTTLSPTKAPTVAPTSVPSTVPTLSPTKAPIASTSNSPTTPSSNPTEAPRDAITTTTTTTSSTAISSATSTSNDEQGDEDGVADESAATTSTLQDDDDQGEPATDSFIGIDDDDLSLIVYVAAGMVLLFCLLLCCALCMIAKRSKDKKMQERFETSGANNSTHKTTKARVASVSSHSPTSYDSNQLSSDRVASEGADHDTDAVVIRIENKRTTGGLGGVYNIEQRNAWPQIDMRDPYGIELVGVPPPPPMAKGVDVHVADDDDDDVLMDVNVTTRRSDIEPVNLAADEFIVGDDEHNPYGVQSNTQRAGMYADDDNVLATITTAKYW